MAGLWLFFLSILGNSHFMQKVSHGIKIMKYAGTQDLIS